MVLNERVAHYEIQIKENQVKMDQDARDIQDLRTELIKLHEEKTIHEEQSRKTIFALKQDFDKLQTESNDRGTLPFHSFLLLNFSFSKCNS
jgi:hypothetical protein